MDTESLKIFTEVMERGSFAAVARDRDQDPSSISRTIAALEEDIGVRLFQRTTRRLAPTEAGMEFLERITPLISELDEACSKARDASAEPSGSLRITSSIAFGNRILSPLLSEFRERCPEVRLELLLTDAIVDLISERIDIAIRLGPSKDSGLISTKLFNTEYRVCASANYIEKHGAPEKPEDLSERDCVRLPLTGHRTTWRFKNRNGKITAVPVDGSITISNPLALYQAVRNGCGPALLSNFIADEDINNGRLIDLFPEYAVTAADFDTAAWLLYPSKNYLPSKTRAFIDFLKEKIRTAKLK